jgi:altronate dehydratase small subunit
MVEKRSLILNPRDNVASVMEDVSPGDDVVVKGGKETHVLKAIEKIPFGFKMATADISRGEAVLKYGEVIGRASMHIKKGALVHVHNIEGARGRGDLQKNS